MADETPEKQAITFELSADDVERLKKQFPKLELADAFLQSVVNTTSLKTASRFKGKISELLGDKAQEIDLDKITGSELAKLVKETVAPAQDEKGQVKKVSLEYAQQLEQVKTEYAQKEKALRRQAVIAQLRAKLPPAQKNVKDTLIAKIIEDEIRIDFDGDSVEFGLVGDDKPYLPNGKPAGIDDMAKIIADRYGATLFAEPVAGFNSRTGLIANGGAKDWMKATDADFMAAASIPMGNVKIY